MSRNRRVVLVTVAVATLHTVAPALAQSPQPPDCTGISDVSDFDGTTQSDFDGQLTTVRVASGLLSPVFVTSPPDRPDGPDDRLFIVEQRGTIRILDLPSGTLLASFFLDIRGIVVDTGNEEGLLSMAFHPEYNTPGAPNEGKFFIYFTNAGGNNQVSRYSVTPDPDDADETSGELVIEIPHPSFRNHNGGQIAFGPDDRLYIAPGDGGSACDPFNTGQNIEDLRGKVLRLNVDSFPPYTTEGNPFDGATPGLDEIWAYGLRNPWRFSFDRGTGALYVGDVGQGVWEEVNCQPATSTGGENYGWDFYEGNHCPPPVESMCSVPITVCNTIVHTKNILEYDHSRDGFSCSITGGYVYRGCRMSDLHGSYFYADFCSDNIRTFRTNGTCSVLTAEINRTTDLDPPGAPSVTAIASFGEDSRGELYICDRGGEVFKVVPDLEIIELSAANAAPMRATGDDFTWEDLQATSGHPITQYKVYRSDGDPTGPFGCEHQGPDNVWLGGDPQTPLSGGTFFYVVTALNAQGQETRPGTWSDGTARNVATASVCP